ncbi:MAG: 3-beta hydroxysteroid dehydrogenase, partial [Cyanobacteria bacterium J06626_23]
QAIGQIYNISGERYVTFDGLARACAIATGKSPDDLELVHYDPKAFDFGKKKAFPMRVQHFFAAIDKAKAKLNWMPQFDLVSGLKDSFINDFQANNRAEADFDASLDDQILAKA